MGCAHFNDHESNADNDPKILTQEPQTASKCCITSLLSKAMAISRDDLPVLFCLSGSAPASNNTSIFIEFYRGTWLELTFTSSWWLFTVACIKAVFPSSSSISTSAPLSTSSWPTPAWPVTDARRINGVHWNISNIFQVSDAILGHMWSLVKSYVTVSREVIRKSIFRSGEVI